MCTVFVTLVQCFRVAHADNVPNFPVFVLVLVPLVQCFAWPARAMCLFARVRTRTVRESLHSVYCACTPCTAFLSASADNVPTCPCSYSYWYSFVQCFAWSARAMYLYARACILIQGNPSHVRIFVFGLSRCTCSATPTDMDSLLVMSRDVFFFFFFFYKRCICASCLYLPCRGAIVRLPVCTADREGGWQPR